MMNSFHILIPEVDEAALLKLLGRLFGQEGRNEWDQEAGARCFFHVLAMQVVFDPEHPYEDDLGIAFSAYRSALEIVPLRISAGFYEDFVRMTALFLGEYLGAHLSVSTLVVHNLQTKVAEFTNHEAV